jgi:hypothetical protein
MKAAPRLVILILVTASSTVLAGAAMACNPGRANNGHIYQDGWLTGPSHGEQCSSGSWNDITIRDPYVLIGSGAWTMIYYGTTGHFAQVGYAKITGKPDRNFLEFNTADLGDVLKWPSNVPEPTVGSVKNYKVDYGAGGNSFHFFIGGTIVYSSASTGYLGCDAAQAGETKTLADQMPGISTNQEHLDESFIRTVFGWGQSTLWQTYIIDEFTGGDASAYFGNHSPDFLSDDDIWDKCT